MLKVHKKSTLKNSNTPRPLLGIEMSKTSGFTDGKISVVLGRQGTNQASQPLGCAAKPDLSSWLAYLPIALPFTLTTEYKTGELVLVKKEVVIFTRAPYLGLILTV